jgi:hypothetical protein
LAGDGSVERRAQGAAYLSQDGRFGVWGKIRANGAAL